MKSQRSLYFCGGISNLCQGIMFFTKIFLCLLLVRVSKVQGSGHCQKSGTCQKAPPPPPPPPERSPPPAPSTSDSGDCYKLHESSNNTFEDPQTRTCYYFYDVKVTHAKAVALCENQNTRVVELGLKSEQDWLLGNIQNPGQSPPSTKPSLWLGLFRQSSGVWNWVYKTRKWPVHNPRWISSSPSSASGYTLALTDHDGQWRAVTDVETGQVVCETLEDLTTPTPPLPTTTSPMKTVPSWCPKVGGKTEDLAISEYKRLSIKVLVTDLNESFDRRETRIGCAKRCSERPQCVMFIKQDRGKCYLFRFSNSGSPSDCEGNPSVCYWKSCWIPELDVAP